MTQNKYGLLFRTIKYGAEYHTKRENSGSVLHVNFGNGFAPIGFMFAHHKNSKNFEGFLYDNKEDKILATTKADLCEKMILFYMLMNRMTLEGVIYDD